MLTTNKRTPNSELLISFWELFRMFIEQSRGCYSSIFIPHVYAKNEDDYNNDLNVFEEMTISEQNFFDEDNKAMTLKEILEEVCKVLKLDLCRLEG